jgi:hypothetical protein
LQLAPGQQVFAVGGHATWCAPRFGSEAGLAAKTEAAAAAPIDPHASSTTATIATARLRERIVRRTGP